MLASVAGFAAALIYYAAPGSRSLTVSVWLDALLAGAASLAFLLAYHLLIKHLLRGRSLPRENVYLRILRPTLWPGAARRRPLTPRDWARRAFVTTSAATGAVVGAMAADARFWTPLLHALAPERIVFTLALTAVSVFLLGPVEEYVFDPHPGDEEGGPTAAIARMISTRSWSAFGRMALVALAIFGVNIVHTCFAERAAERSVGALVVMVVASAGPGVITYYWAAALQMGADSILRRAGLAATLLGAILAAPFAGAIAGEAARPWVGDMFMLGLAAALVAGPVAAAGASLVLLGLVAMAGGATLDWVRRRAVFPVWAAVGVLAIVVCAVSAALFAAGDLLLSRLWPPLPHDLLRGGLISVLGWMIALGLSDFPRIATEARTQAPPLTPPTAPPR